MSTRHPRFNARREVWCFNCHQYLHADRFRLVSYPSRPKPYYWSYCIVCCRELDRIRWCGERRVLNNASRVVRRRKQQRAERAERTRFCLNALDLLMRRGFTISEVSRLTGLTLQTFYVWRKGKHRPTWQVEERMGIVVRETGYLKAGTVPAKGRRTPHPDLSGLMERLAPELARYPVRSRWSKRGTA